MSLPKIAIIELGSQYTLLIERSLRELGYRSIVMEPKRASKWLAVNPVQLIILSGGPASVYDKNPLQPPEEIWTTKGPDGQRVMIFCICYGMQLAAQRFGGTVEPAHSHRQYGPALVRGGKGHWLFAGTPDEQEVYASHGDTVTSTGEFTNIAESAGGIAAIEHRLGDIVGVQFHPEVAHTAHGKRMLQNVLDRAGCRLDWQPTSMVSHIQENLLRVTHKQRSIMLYSGGVDSSVLAAIASPVLKGDLLAVTIDGNQLRENELDEIVSHAEACGVQHRIVSEKWLFNSLMRGVTKAEEKRDCFKAGYVTVTRGVAAEFGASIVHQGTLAPDIIESGHTGGDNIKSHHNVGLDLRGLEQTHVMGHLFKYEVRALARELKLPDSISDRHPFPGPGLFIRTIGIEATDENVSVTRWATKRVDELLMQHGMFAQVSQPVTGYFGTETVGVKGDKKAYTGFVVVRAVRTTDFMTAKGVHFSEDFQDDVQTILTRHNRINRALFDTTDKPPGTTEFE